MRRFVLSTIATVIATVAWLAALASAWLTQYFVRKDAWLGEPKRIVVFAGVTIALLVLSTALVRRWRWLPSLAFALVFSGLMAARLEGALWVGNHYLHLNLRVGYLYDDRFPDFDAARLERALALAGEAVRREFGADFVTFAEPRPITVDGMDLMERGIVSEAIQPAFARVTEAGLDIPVFDPYTPGFMPMSEGARAHLTGLGLPTLLAFLPPERRAGVGDLDAFYAAMLEVMGENAAAFRALEISGRRVFTEDARRWQTVSGWRRYFLRQQDFDLVFTNTLVFDDWINPPAPHSILGQGKVGGLGHVYSPKAPAGIGYGAMVSTISFVGYAPFAAVGVNPETAEEPLGVYVVAHEIGHLLFDLPDTYDASQRCLMDNVKKPDIPKFLQAFAKKPWPCKKCAPGVRRGVDRLLLDTP